MTVRIQPVFRYGVSFIKIPDYLAIGRLVISPVESFKIPISDAGAGISVRGEPVALANAIAQLSERSLAERVAMGKRVKALRLSSLIIQS